MMYGTQESAAPCRNAWEAIVLVGSLPWGVRAWKQAKMGLTHFPMRSPKTIMV